MRIVLLQDYLRGGGTETQTVHLATHFKQRGHSVSVLTYRNGGVLAGKLQRAGVDQHILQPIDTPFNFWAPGLCKELRHLKPDIILCMGRMAHLYVKKVKKQLPKVKVVATLRTGKPLKPWYRNALDASDLILSNSKWWVDRLIETGTDEDKVHVINNALTRPWEVIDFENERRRARAQFKLSEEEVVFLNVAGMRKGKRHSELIEAFSKIDSKQSCQLWIVGGGKQRAPCEALAQQLNIGERVRFMGYQSEVLPYFAAADIAVSMSTEDAQPNFLVEAQWAGLPTLAVDYKGVQECFIKGKSGYTIPVGDTQTMSLLMHELIQDDDMRASMSKAAQANAKDKFDPTRNSDRFLEHFENLIQK